MMDEMETAGVMREVFGSALYSAITLYMLAILARWTAPFLSLDLYQRGLRLIPRITDPLLQLIRHTLPPMGFTDWSPVAAMLILYMVRVLVVGE